MLQSCFTPAVLILYFYIYIHVYILMLYSCFTPACLAVCVYISALLLLYSGFTYNTFNLYNIRVGRVVEQKLFIFKAFKAVLRHLALVFEGLSGLKHFVVRFY
jgi:hypothetical protein